MITKHGRPFPILAAVVSRSQPRPRGRKAVSAKGGIAGITIVLLMVVSASGRDPITIKLEGTAIDTLPDSVEVYVSSPREAADEFLKKGGTRYQQAKNDEATRGELVSYRRVDYLFKMPENAPPNGSNQQFKRGDIIYVFNLESQEEANAFAKKYSLRENGTIPVGRKTKNFYAAGPGYFVFFRVRTTIYYCPMDPDQDSDRPGKCPICGMPFSEAKRYR